MGFITSKGRKMPKTKLWKRYTDLVSERIHFIEMEKYDWVEEIEKEIEKIENQIFKNEGEIL